MKIGNVIFTNKNNFNSLETFIVKHKYTKIAIVCDENTKKNCLNILLNNCKILSNSVIIETKSGEENKTIEACLGIIEILKAKNFDRHSLLISLGGGLLSDLGGFAASIYKRGIDTINIPTTLLSMVDASVGGKNGVNLDGTKNLLGTITQPKLVYVNSEFIKSQDNRQIINGMAEIIKIAIIKDKRFFQQINNYKSTEEFINLKTIQHSVKLKNDVVTKDPFEKNIRKCLNFGHTIGHAIESAFINDNKDILHGEAVAAGMIMETYIASQLWICSANTQQKVEKIISTYFKPIKLSNKIEKQLHKHVIHDKKNVNDKITIVVPDKIGNFKIIELNNTELLSKAILYYKNRFK